MSDPQPATIGPSRRELELEYEVWIARDQANKNAAAALQAQTQLLQNSARECAEQLARLGALLKPADVTDAAPQAQVAA